MLYLAATSLVILFFFAVSQAKKVWFVSFILTLIFQLGFNAGFLFLPNKTAQAAFVQNNAAGTYTDDFANNSGVPTRDYVNANASTGKLQLTSAASQTTFTAPLKTSGSAITGVIRPLIIAKWNTISYTRTVPANTTLKVQVMDDVNALFADEYLPGNSTGIEAATIDISNVPILACAVLGSCSKPYVIKIKFLMTTTDTAVTPTMDDLSVSWTRTQGDLSAAGPANTAWSSYSANQKGTVHSPYANPETYPTFKWASDKYLKDYGVESLFIFSDKIFGYSGYYGSNMFATDRDTGEELWRIPFNRCSGPEGTISSNGTFYGTDIGCDGFYVIDTNTGQLKWLYDFVGGHGNDSTVLTADGTVYTIRNGTTGGVATVYAFNPDGSIKWQQDITLSAFAGDALNIGQFAVGSDETLYFGFSTADANYASTNHGKLYAVNPTDGSVKWTYDSGDLEYLAPLIDSDGTIYIVRSPTNPVFDVETDEVTPVLSEKKIWAINSDGTLKWEKSMGTDMGQGYGSLSLRSDGVLMAIRVDSASWSDPYKLEAISTSDGSLLWSRETKGYRISFTDSNNGLVYTDSAPGEGEDEYYARVNYFDAADNLKWRIAYPYNALDGTNNAYYSFGSTVQDERGWIYSGLGRSYYTADGDAIPDQNFAQPFALAPWTLTDLSNISGTKVGGNILNFSAISSMLETNPLFGGDNQIQAVMDNGDKVPLTYDSTDENGNTLWSGSYILPINTPAGSHSYTIEASQAYLQTDNTTNFTSAPSESNNTGITRTGTFESTASLTITDPTPENLVAEFTSGRISISGADPTQTDSFTFNVNYNFSVGEANVFIPEGTQVTDSNGEPLDLTQLKTELATTLVQAQLDNILGAIKISIPNKHLTFSQPITVTIPVGQENNGRTLQVIFQREGESDWNEETTCKVADGSCTFQTNHAATFGAQEIPDKAKITSWKVSQYEKPDTKCVQRLEVDIKGKYFAKKAEVRIGNQEAFSINRKSSKEISAKFCLTKLLDVKTTLKRSISVTNPDTDKVKAKKKINLSVQSTISGLAATTPEGIKSIQGVLVKLGYLNNQCITGFYGPLTTEAVKKFQGDHGLPQTGIVDPVTREELGKG